MNPKRLFERMRALLAVLCVVALVPGDTFARVLLGAQAQTSASGDAASRIPADQLD